MAAGPVTILLTNFNGLANLQACLPGVLEAASRPDIPCEVLLVDDGSTDESVPWLTRHHPQVKVVAQPTNGGFLSAANAGFAAATTRHVALLSNDMVPRADFLSVLLPHFADPSVFAVSSCLVDPAGRPEGGRSVGLFLAGNLHVVDSAKGYRPFGAFVRARDDVAAPSLFTGGNALYDREKFLALGGFDPLFHPFYWEDTDLCYRAWKRGWKVLSEPGSQVTHHQQMGTIRRTFDREMVRTVRKRNRLLFTWKNIRDPLFLGSHVVALVVQLLFSWLGGNLRFYRSLRAALDRLPTVMDRRRQADSSDLSDREVLSRVRVQPGDVPLTALTESTRGR